MRDDERFEISRALDLLPHVVGASFATVQFRLEGRRHPTAEEFRERCAMYFEAACVALDSFPNTIQFGQIRAYLHSRMEHELASIVGGDNKEIEKRYERYIDYG